MFIAYLLMTILLVISMLLIFIILLQRGRGGGLAGALGGMGGQSAFGTKAGDVFTKITVILAMVWIVLAAGAIPLMRYLAGNRFIPGTDAPSILTAPPIKEGGKAFPEGAEDNDGQPAVAPPAKKVPETTTGQAEAEPKSSEAVKTDGEQPATDQQPTEEKPPAKDAPEETKDQPQSEAQPPSADDQPKTPPDK